MNADASRYFMGPQHAKSLAALQYSLLSNAGLTLISAGIGMGKSLLIRRAKMNLDDSIVVGMLANTHADFKSVLPWILASFELRSEMSSAVAMYETLNQFLDEMASNEKRVVLVIDEAQNLSNSALEELRLLLNLNDSDKRGIQIVLIGLPLLKDRLMHASMSEIAQRVAVDVELEPLDFQSTDDYITFQLSLVGGKPEIFDYVSRAAIFFHSRGIPRLINSICDLSLVYGFGESLESIDLKLVKNVLLSKKVALNTHHAQTRTAEAADLREAILAARNQDIAEYG